MRARRGLEGACVVAMAALTACGGRGDPTSRAEAAPVAGASAPIDSGQGGTTRWVKRLGGQGDEGVLALATSADGSATLLTGIGPAWRTRPSSLGLVRLDRSGAVSWATALANPEGAAIEAPAMAVSPLGNVFVVARISCGAAGGCALDLGQGPITGSVLFKFAPPGALAWQRALGGALTSGVAVDSHGGPLVAFTDGGGTERLLKHGWDGSVAWDRAAPLGQGVAGGVTAVAFDPWDDVAIGAGLRFGKLDATGNLLWSADVAAAPNDWGMVRGIGTTAIGTIVAAIEFSGAVAYAGTYAHPMIGGGALLVVAERDGSPRFAREFAGDSAYTAGIAVDPGGRVAILTRGGECGDAVQRWNLAGDLLWSRPWASAGCGASGVSGAGSIAIDPTTHDVLVGGWFTGTQGFGTGPITSHGGSDDVVVDIAP